MILVISGQTGISGGEVVLGNSLRLLRGLWKPLVICPQVSEVQKYFEETVGIDTKPVSYLTTSQFERKSWGPFARIVKAWKSEIAVLHFFLLCLRHRPKKILCNTPGDAHLSFVAQMLGIPFFQYIHEDYRSRKSLQWYFFGLQFFITKFICVGSSCAEALSGIDESKKVVVHNGVEVQRFADHSISRPLRLVFAGSLDERKNPLLALQCLEKATKVTACRLDLYYHYASNETLKQVQDEIQSKGLPVRLIYKASRQELLDAFAMSDFLVLTSQSEGLPTVILEAMSFGTPAFSTDVGSVRDIIQHTQNGFLFQTPQEFSSLLEKILKSEITESQLRQKAHQTILQKFSVQQASQKLDRVMQGS